MKNEDYKQLLEKICTLVENDFCADMEVRTMTTDGKYPEITQEEAREMASRLASVYYYVHQVHCGAHKDITGVFKSKEDIDKFFLEKYNV